MRECKSFYLQQRWINPKWDKYLWCMFQMKRVEKDIREALAQNEPVPDLVKWIEVCFCNHLCDSKLSWFLLDFVSNFIMVLDVAAFFLLQWHEVKRSSDKHVSFNGCKMLQGGFFFPKNCVFGQVWWCVEKGLCVLSSNFSFRCVWRDDLQVTLNCLSVSNQKNVPQAILSDTAFLRLLMTLVLRKCLPVPQSDYTVCVDLSLECVVVYHKTDKPYCCSTVFSF